MGVDIHMDIVSPKGEFVRRNLYDGRNRAWFDSLRMDVEGWLGDSQITLPEDLQKMIEDYDGWGFRAVKVGDMIKWLIDKKPFIQVGWTTKVHRMNHFLKKYYPMDEYVYNSETALKEIEGENEKPVLTVYLATDHNANYYWLFKYLCKNVLLGKISKNDYLTYWFDN